MREGFGLLEKRSGSSHMQSEEEIHTPFQYIKQSKANPTHKRLTERLRERKRERDEGTD